MVTATTASEQIESKTDEIASLPPSNEMNESKPVTMSTMNDEMEYKTESVDTDATPEITEPEAVPLPISISTMKEEFKYKIGLKEKDLKLGLEHTFKDIPVNVFWEWFWSENAKFSPIDWIKEDPLTSNVSGTDIVPLEEDTNGGLRWSTRTITCNREIVDAPSIVTA